MLSPHRAVLVFLECQFAHVAVGLFAIVRLDAREVLPEPKCAVPCGRAGKARARRNALQARMAEHGDRAVRHHRQRLHVHGEGVDLYAVDLVTGEGAGQSVDADILRLDVAGGFVELADKDLSSRSCRSCRPRTVSRPGRVCTEHADRRRSVP